MLVVCPQCDSRYQLPDAKIRPTGTKVRCPNCQHKFVVRKPGATAKAPPQKAPRPAPSSPRAGSSQPPSIEEQRKELFQERPFEASRQAKIAQPSPAENRGQRIEDEPTVASQDSVYEREDVFSSSTRVSDSPESRSIPGKPVPEREPSPFRKQTPQPRSSEDSFAEQAIDEPSETTAASEMRSSLLGDEFSEKSEVDEIPENRPFGDATFLAIQQMSHKKKRFGKRLGVVAAVAAIIGLGVLAFPYLSTLKMGRPVSVSNQAIVEISRPSSWYKDDPKTFSQTLGQMAILPKKDRGKAENRALLSEALVLNGLYTGSFDQVSKGLAISSSLITAHPYSPHGYYAVTAFHLLNQDLNSLRLVIEKWPEKFQRDLEYQLAAAVIRAEDGKLSEALNEIKGILEQQNDFQRALSWGFYLSLRNPQAAEELLGERWIETMKTRHLRHRDFLVDQGFPLTELYKNTDRAYAKVNPKHRDEISGKTNSVKKEESAPKETPSKIKKKDPIPRTPMKKRASKKTETSSVKKKRRSRN